MRVDVLDLSHWNTVTSGESASNHGIIGVIHKATEGTGYVDNTLFNRAKRALELGICWSTYHFLRPGSLDAQMEHYLGTIDPVQGERVCLDHEDVGVSLSDLKQCVQYIRNKRPDLQITIYSGNLIKEQLGSVHDDFLAENTSLWLAQYTTGTPSWPQGTWPSYTLWQFTDGQSGEVHKIPGVDGPVDCNEFNGSRDNCIKWFGPTSEPKPIPEPGPRPESTLDPNSINITIETGSKVKVNKITINGEER